VAQVALLDMLVILLLAIRRQMAAQEAATVHQGVIKMYQVHLEIQVLDPLLGALYNI
jgi:hypothetical protein